MISVDQALQIVLERVAALGVETCKLEHAHERILAEDVRADIDLPPFDRARMDGYALRAEDAQVSPVRLKLIGEIAAGASFLGTLSGGQAVKIFTGAPIPAGADSVQKVEVTESDGDSVLIKEAVKRGQFVTPRASEVNVGEIVASAGRDIGPAEMAVLASFGFSSVKVGRRPRVAVLSTGSELVEVRQKPTAAQIRNSNTYTIAAYAHRAGAVVNEMGIVRDTPEATRTALVNAAKEHEIVITSGGVSMGDYDLVKATLTEIGADLYFEKVSIRPGKPTVFGKLGDTYFFGLPGNPVSTSVTFNVFARPAIRKMQGDSFPLLPTVKVELEQPLRDSSSRRSYLPALLRINAGRATVQHLKWGGSSDLVAFMKANALIIVREEVHELEAGEVVDVLLLNRG